MANRLFQGLIVQMRSVVGRTIGVIDKNAEVVACSEPQKIGTGADSFTLNVEEVNDIFMRDGYTYQPFGERGTPCYAVFVEGTDETASKFAALLGISLSTLKQFYDEKYDRGNFIKNIVLDNILPVDISVKGRELHFNTDMLRVVFLVHIQTATDVSAFDVVQSLFPDKHKDFVFSMDTTSIVLVKEIRPTTELKDLEKLAKSISYTLSAELYTKVMIGIGSIVVGIKDLAKSFKEAQTALEVGKVFDSEKTIISYDDLGIARLIYHLPTTLCETFLKEVLKKGTIDSFDHETMFTIQRFFENNLNVSETSRKLFVHRNTLVYRLDKIKKVTGLDLREFDHAIVFKIAMMANKCLASDLKKI
ncbi:MAG: helix-turn-helix domain-containing protein [Oscillospiraceae bacterium]|jgi:carbohydrate diacid regulator|nr:helix-turn-helix domain-containing protein [Oscillospiraceae bacterium]